MWSCRFCNLTREKPTTRLPGGWKRLAEAEDTAVCQKCWGKRYLLRAITVPIASPLESTWEELNAELHRMWAMTTNASNYIMTELYTRDVKRNGHEKLPPMPAVYLYPELRRRWPDLPSRTVATLEHSLALKYRALRYDILWTARKSLPSFRYPAPFPIPAQGWTIAIENETPVLSVTIGDKRMRLRLKGDPRFRRQRRSIEQITAGEAVTGEMAIYKSGDHTLVKLVAWLPRPAEREGLVRSGTLRVRTAHDSLLVAVNEKDDQLWRYNGDHLVRWIAEHKNRIQRWAEDQKYEQRPVPSFVDRRTLAAEKYRSRMNTACHEIAAQLANYADRRKFQSVVYDDLERGFVPQFPYFKLQELIQEKLDEKGIEFALVTGLSSTEVRIELQEALDRG